MKKKHFAKLRGKMVEEGFTLQDLAKNIGITTQALGNKLRGDTSFTQEEMLRACSALNAPVSIFFDPELHKEHAKVFADA